MSISEKTKYIFSEGELKRKDNSLAFRSEDKWNYIPIENIREIYLMNETSVTTNLLGFLAKHGILLHFFNYYGYYTGTFYPREKYISGKVTSNQVRKFDSSRNEIAKNIVTATAENFYDLLYYYRYHGHEYLQSYLDYIKADFTNSIDNANNINQIMAVEGELWQKFYMNFEKVLVDKFEFDKRTKRPPKNPINAMISFGNTILYTKTLSQLYFTQLNPEISYLHEPTDRRFSLALDIAEPFKAPIVFKTILNLSNKNQIDPDKHFDTNVNSCMLNEAGKKIFLTALESQFSKTFKHKTLKRHTSYLHAIRLDGYKLTKWIVENKEFIPFNSKELRWIVIISLTTFLSCMM